MSAVRTVDRLRLEDQTLEKGAALRQRAAALTCTARLGGMRHAAGLAEEQLPIARRATSRRARVQRDHRDNASGSRRDEQAGKRRVAEPAQARADQTRPKGWAETAARGGCAAWKQRCTARPRVNSGSISAPRRR